MMNDHFIQSEVEYLRQRRLAAAAEHRQVRSAARRHSLRARFSAAVEHLVPGRTHQDPTARAA